MTTCNEAPSDVEKGDVQLTIQNSTPSPDHPESTTSDATAGATAATTAENGKMNPMMKIMQEKDMGKFLLASAIAILGIVVAGKDRFHQSEISFVLSLVSGGFIAILYGIALKETFPKVARFLEAVGIALVAVSFFSIIAFFLPVEFIWVPALCIVLLFLLPLITLVSPPVTEI